MADSEGVSVGKIGCGVVLGLVLFFLVLPMAMCGGCATCAGIGMMNAEERQKVRAAEPPPRSQASLLIETHPVHEVEVYLDGHLITVSTPIEVDNLQLGDHTIEVKAAGYHPYKQTFAVQEHRAHTLTIPLEPKPTRATAASSGPESR